MLPSEWVWLRQHKHSQAGNAARAGVWAGWEEQGEQLSNSTTTVTNDTGLDFARNTEPNRGELRVGPYICIKKG